MEIHFLGEDSVFLGKSGLRCSILASQLPEEVDGKHSILTLGCPGSLPVLPEKA